MLYPFMTLNDGTEIVHSETIETAGKEKVEVRIEKPVYGGFHSATCWLPEYKWENIDGFSPEDIQYFQELLESVAHIILQLAREGGIEGGLDDAQVFKIAGYTVYFWVNENDPLEPVHVHISKGVPSPNATKIWITKNGKCLLCNNNSKIPDKQLRVFMQIIEARSKSVLDLWYSTFKQISFYC